MSQTLTTPSARFQAIFDGALEQYKKRTKNDLTSHPLAAQLQRCGSPSAVLAILQEQGRELEQSRSNDESLTKWLGPTVNVLYAFSETLSEGLGLVFSPSKVIFAGIGVLLITAKEVNAGQDALIDIFGRVENFLTRLETYLEVTPTTEMTNIMMKIMIEVLSILSVATKDIKEGRIKKYLKKLLVGGSDIENALKRLDALTQEETRMAIAQVLKASRSIEERVKAVSEDGQKVIEILETTEQAMDETKRNQMRDDLRRWLSAPDPSTNHNVARNTQYQGTAAWFFEGNTFKEWKSTGPLLWIYGKPGSGKSILCSAIIEDIIALRKAGQAAMAYFYLDFRETNKQTRQSLLLSLLTQFSAWSDSCCDILFHLYSEHGNGVQKPSDNALTQCLKEMLLTDHGPTYVIVDALDECPNTPGVPSAREQVLQLLKDLVDLHLPNLHVCVTSRPEIDIRTALDSLGCQALSLHDQSGQKQDIVKYVRSVVYSDPMMKRWREEDKNLVTETLTEKADGMFRWVFCQLEILRHCLPPSLRRTLDELPESLDKTYERILKDIKKPNQVHAHRLLQCLTVAIRPLSVEELGEVLAVDFDEVEGIPKLNTDWRWEDQEQAVLAACSSLITVANFRGGRVVQFSHFSVKEYLTSTRLASSGGEASRYHILLERAHATLAQASLGVLFALDEHVDGFNIDRFPLAEYSAQYWINHAQFKNVSTHIQHEMEHLFDPDRRHFRVWVRVHDLDKDYWPIPPWAPPPLLEAPAAALYYAALCGFCDIVDRLLTRYPQYLHAMGGVHGTALHAASRGNHCGAAQAIIKFGGDVNVRCPSGRTPLHVASSAGHLDATQWLLHHGADVNAQDNEGHNPLHLLVREARLQVDDQTPNARNHLGSRQCDQSVEVARLLLEHGVDVDAKDRSGQTVYEIASTRGYRDVMKLLP